MARKSRTIELKWNCGECSTTGIRGRHKRCPNCGSPREKGEMRMDGLNTDRDGDGYNDAATVTDPELLKLARAGADWFCSHCTSGNRGDGERCSSCGAPRYGKAEEDHPDFEGDHRKVVIGDDPWEDDYDPETWNPDNDTPDLPPPNPRESVAQAWERIQHEQTYAPDPVDDWEIRRRKQKDNERMFLFGGLAVAAVLLIGFLIWAFQTHEATGKVTSMTWAQNTVVQTWTQTTERHWKHQTSERREIEPRNGSGERAGMEIVGGSCREEHYDDERYVCGSHEECTPRTRTETYDCGETCTDNGNGFATCTTKTCTRTVPDGEDCRMVDEYCTRPIYETRCTYRTQEWRTTDTRRASGSGTDTRWPEAQPGRLDRLRYAADYTVMVAYRDRGKDKVYEYKPGDTTWLGMTQLLTKTQAHRAEAAYKEWAVGESAVLTVNNLGGVHQVSHTSER